MHALLGCGVHHACQHGEVAIRCTAGQPSEHHCAGHHHDDFDEPDGDEREPADPCQHAVCSYVKAELARVDLSDAAAASFTQVLPVEPAVGELSASAVIEPICKVDLSSTQLYVWHCALII